MTRYDAIIVGAGQAGPPLAGRLTDAGMRVALIERKLVGGTCVNTGCMPTKTLVASAYAAHLARRRDLGIIIGDVGIDMAAVAARAHQVTINARTNNETWLAGMTRYAAVEQLLEAPALQQIDLSALRVRMCSVSPTCAAPADRSEKHASASRPM